MADSRRIIVTGGASGIGAAIVTALTRVGAQVASLDVQGERGEAVVQAANKTGSGTATFHYCDISSRDDVEAAFARSVSILGGLDGLVNVAGVENSCPPEDIADAVWDRMIAINVTGTYLTNQIGFRYLRDDGGVILNFASDTALSPYPSAPHYAATKGAVVSWTRSVAAAWGKYGVRANSICPSMRTPMYDAHCAAMTPEQLMLHQSDLSRRMMIRGELGDPLTDLAPVVLFMLSEGARFVTGQIISVNGGLGVTR
jgi:NAD(P)-dependent dehydrogenase (short-subunit alcohol dehydrogenase family)